MCLVKAILYNPKCTHYILTFMHGQLILLQKNNNKNNSELVNVVSTTLLFFYEYSVKQK